MREDAGATRSVVVARRVLPGRGPEPDRGADDAQSCPACLLAYFSGAERRFRRRQSLAFARRDANVQMPGTRLEYLPPGGRTGSVLTLRRTPPARAPVRQPTEERGLLEWCGFAAGVE